MITSPTAGTFSREQVTTFSTPAGTPAASKISAKIIPPVNGVSSDGFSTTQFPAAIGNASPRAVSNVGKFQGEITVTTPIGRRIASDTLP